LMLCCLNLYLLALIYKDHMQDTKYKLTPTHLKIFKKFGLSEKKDPITKITKAACIKFAVTSPKAVQIHF